MTTQRTTATVALLTGRSWAPRTASLTAALLTAWLLGQTVFVGFSVFQPVYLVVAAVIAGLARELTRPGPTSPRRGSGYGRTTPTATP